MWFLCTCPSVCVYMCHSVCTKGQWSSCMSRICRTGNGEIKKEKLLVFEELRSIYRNLFSSIFIQKCETKLKKKEKQFPAKSEWKCDWILKLISVRDRTGLIADLLKPVLLISTGAFSTLKKMNMSPVIAVQITHGKLLQVCRAYT